MDSTAPTRLARNRRVTQLGLAALALALLGVAFAGALADMWHEWTHRDEYSHAPLLPLIALFMAWLRVDRLRELTLRGSWSGFWLVGVGLVLNALGSLSTIFVIQLYAMMLVLVGAVVAVGGWRLARELWMALTVLALMIPLPYLVLNTLSAQLQLVSSQLGVWMLRAAQISVYLEGNVIDLGTYRLQVAEACSGLNYLFPLITLAFLMACFFRAPFWQRAALVVSALPITVIMNSLRIAMIGVMVERWGIAMAEGFLHQFQGWAVFMLSAVLLYGEMLLLARLARVRTPWHRLLTIEWPQSMQTARQAGAAVAPSMPGTVSRASLGCLLALGVAALAAAALPARGLIVPEREVFSSFPLRVGAWQGQRTALQQVYLDTLKLDDYFLGDYAGPSLRPVNLYMAWYDSQTSGVSTHSPRSCLPGGGWRIVDLREFPIAAVHAGKQSLRVNRAFIEYGADRELVYYWFQQRGRVITNEYLVKWYLFWDALTRHRTDGALVRLIVPVRAGELPDQSDRELSLFLASIWPQLNRFVPG